VSLEFKKGWDRRMDLVWLSRLSVANRLEAHRWFSVDHESGGEMLYELGRITPKTGSGPLNEAAGAPTTIVMQQAG